MLLHLFESVPDRALLQISQQLERCGLIRQAQKELLEIGAARLHRKYVGAQGDGGDAWIWPPGFGRDRLFNGVAIAWAAGELNETRTSGRILRCQRALGVFSDGALVVALVFIDRARFVAEQRRIVEFFAAVVNQAQRVVKTEVVPENRGRFEIAAGCSGLNARDAVPGRFRAREQFAIGVDFTESREGRGVSRRCACQVLLNIGGDSRVSNVARRVISGQRPE